MKIVYEKSPVQSSASHFDTGALLKVGGKSDPLRSLSAKPEKPSSNGYFYDHKTRADFAMEPAFERTPHREWESFHCELLQGPSYNATWHFHPEFQITLVLKSSGYRLVGDNITPLEPGDLVLVGANLPHVWKQDETQKGSGNRVHAVIVRFLENFLGPGFLEAPEVEPVRQLLKRASRGLHIKGRLRDKVAAELERLCDARGMDRIVRLLYILDQLANSEGLTPIASAGFMPKLSVEDHARVDRVITFIHSHLAEPIDREVVAEQAHMSAGAFSRFFKLRTGKTLPQYINELRVGRACRLLANEQIKVIDLAWESGFRNLANFNRCFRDITKLTPREYRQQLQRFATKG
jgi:AraC-like DNA-binding protein